MMLIDGPTYAMNRRLKILSHFFLKNWITITKLTSLQGFAIYISGNISGRPGKRKKLIKFIVGQKSFKNLSTYVNTKQKHTTLSTSLINIGFKSIE